jgi:hypothetical protein
MAVNLLNTDVANMKLQFHVDPSVPSPFKRILFWPSSETKNVKKRRKEKIPCVATTQQWKEYHTKKENEKKKLEGEKLETVMANLIKTFRSHGTLRNLKTKSLLTYTKFDINNVLYCAQMADAYGDSTPEACTSSARPTPFATPTCTEEESSDSNVDFTQVLLDLSILLIILSI